MKSISIQLILLILVFGSSKAAEAPEPLLVYERMHSMVADEENTVRLAVYADGNVEAHFPPYSPQAGTYRWSISPTELNRLLDLAAPIANLDSRNLLVSIQTTRSQNMMEVTDADRVSVEINDPGRGRNRVVVPSPDIWRMHLPKGHGMETVATVTTELAAWMRDQAVERAQ